MATLTRWVLAHKRLVVGIWVVVTVAAFAAIQPTVDALSEEFTLPGREAFETNREIAAIYGSGGDVAPIVPVVSKSYHSNRMLPCKRCSQDAGNLQPKLRSCG